MSSSNKVVFLVSFMNVAGAQEACMRVAESLRTVGYDTEIWFLYREAEVERFRRDPGVRVLLETDKPGALGYLKIAWRLYTELVRSRPIATVSFLPLANVLGQFAAVLAGVKRRIASARSPVSTYSRPMRLGDRINARLGIYTGIVGVTREVAAAYRTLPPRLRRHLRVVHNGIVWVPSSLSKAEARQKLGLPQDGFLAASVGRFKTQKNYPFQVEIAARLEKATIVVAGDGPLRAETEARMQALGVSDRMILLGNLDKSDIAHLLTACDVFIQPSLYEGQSNALLEAMHQGMPVLVSDVADQRETIVDDEGNPSGLLIGLDDPQPWADALERLAGEEAEVVRWSEAAARRAADFTLERQREGFRAAIEGVEAPKGKVPALARDGRALGDRILSLIETRYPDPLRDLFRAPAAPHDPTVSLEDIADLIYTFVLLGRSDLLTSDVADRVAARMRMTRLAGALSGEIDRSIERAIVHRTAYGLGALALLKQAGHDRFESVLRPDAFRIDELVDPETHLPRFPARYTHHNWRVSHWIGGVPSILFNLDRHGCETTRSRLSDPFDPRTVLDACAGVVDPQTGLLRVYRSAALQWLFRQLYRIRHDPDLGDLGGIAHLLWVQHALEAAIVGNEPLFVASRAELLKRQPFMEDVPYCLDFDIIENARVAGERTDRITGDDVLRTRANALYRDIRAFYLGEVPNSYTLHKIPGALAAMHEAGLLDAELAEDVKRDLGAGAPMDIISAALWI